MDRNALERRIVARGKEIFSIVEDETPSFFRKGWWSGKVLDLAMRNEAFKTRLFRFVDVFPSLTRPVSLAGHIEEYFAEGDKKLHPLLRFGAKGAARGASLVSGILARTIRSNLEAMARQFIIGEDAGEALPALRGIREEGFASTVDVLGEATVSEEEADRFQAAYLSLLDALETEQKKWRPLGGVSADGGPIDWGHSPMINLSVKPTCLFSQTRASAFDWSVQAMTARFKPILSKARSAGGFACLDMEQHASKDIVLEVYRRLRSAQEYRDWPFLGVVLQAYHRQTGDDLDGLLKWARRKGVSVSVRLVKGAYWDYENVVARQNGWEMPLHTRKAETDAAFERLAETALKNHDVCFFACASHNVRSIAAVIETAQSLGVPENRLEFQLLHGMAEPVQRALVKMGKHVRIYCPYGELVPGMAYLVRRLLENTSNESFLRQRFAESVDEDRLLTDPAVLISEKRGEPKDRSFRQGRGPAGNPPFTNEPQADFTRPVEREGFRSALAAVRRNLGKMYPLLIGGKEVKTGDLAVTKNPADPGEIVGRISQAGRREIDRAIEVAKKALPGWKNTPPGERARFLFKAAALARERIHTLSAWQVFEVGKQWDQAYADVAEAIDYLEYYGRGMAGHASPRRMGNVPGEVNHYIYQPRGVAAVIAPWNFPLAISCGMSSAAIVAGNCVLYKPSGLSSVSGFLLAELFRDADLPQGVFNYVPGRGSVIGDYLVDHPDVSLIAFTGSKEVGLGIIERAGRRRADQSSVKKVIAEMGGKNAIIIDEDADLDEAVVHCVRSAFGFQGQKCSACSRVIVHEAVYKRFTHRFLEAVRSVRIGPAEDPANFIGPVVDDEAQKKINAYAEIGKTEGRLLLEREVPRDGFYAPIAVFDEIRPEHRLAQEEIFGPVLSVMKVKSYREAIEWANATRFALTGSVFSRSPKNLELARLEFDAGNLYLNRGCTGALVGRQPFGGFKLSGVGSKAGGPDYLLQFMEPRILSENTMRRGFTPTTEEVHGDRDEEGR